MSEAALIWLGTFRMLPRVKETRVDSAYDKLKAEIMLGDLSPGLQAPEPELAARLKMSRTPVREALIRLETEGLVELIPRRGARFLSVGVQDLVDVLEILSVLEPLATATISRNGLTSKALAEFELALDAADAAMTDQDILAWIDCDDQIHRLIGKWSNRRLEREIGLHLDQVYRAMRVLIRMKGEPVENSASCHRLIVDAMVQSDADRAMDLARTHRLSELSVLRTVFEGCGVTHL